MRVEPELADERRLPEQRFELRSDLAPLRRRRARHLGPNRAPSPSRKMSPQAAAKVDRLADVDRTIVRVLQHVDARRGRRVAADRLAGPAPRVAAILEHE